MSKKDATCGQDVEFASRFKLSINFGVLEHVLRGIGEYGELKVLVEVIFRTGSSGWIGSGSYFV
jgi:hypothetical protein